MDWGKRLFLVEITIDEETNIPSAKVFTPDGKALDFLEWWRLRRTFETAFTEAMGVYIARGWNDGRKIYKIGASRNLKKRQKHLHFKYQLTFVHTIECASDVVFTVEKKLHDTFAKYRVHGEYFDFNSITDYDPIAFIKSLKSANDVINIHRSLWEYAGRVVA